MALANSRVQYFLPEQIKHLDEFYATVRHGSVIHENKKGEKLQVVRYWLPLGYETELTVKYPQKDGSTLYHTPLATLEDTKDGKVSVTNPENGKHQLLTSHQWFDWLGDEFKTEEIPETPIDPQIATQVENIGQLVEMHKADYESAKKDGWVSASDRKKSKKG